MWTDYNIVGLESPLLDIQDTYTYEKDLPGINLDPPKEQCSHPNELLRQRTVEMCGLDGLRMVTNRKLVHLSWFWKEKEGRFLILYN